jgi:hypothetical protein
MLLNETYHLLVKMLTDEIFSLNDKPAEALEMVMNADNSDMPFAEKEEYVSVLSSLAQFKDLSKEEIADLNEDGIEMPFFQTMVDNNKKLTEKLKEHAPDVFKTLVQKYITKNTQNVLQSIIEITQGLISASPELAAQVYSSIPKGDSFGKKHKYDLLKENIIKNTLDNKEVLSKNELPLLYTYLNEQVNEVTEGYDMMFNDEILHMPPGSFKMFNGLDKLTSKLMNNSGILPFETKKKVFTLLDSTICAINQYTTQVYKENDPKLTSALNTDQFMILGSKIAGFLMQQPTGDQNAEDLYKIVAYKVAADNGALGPEDTADKQIKDLSIPVHLKVIELTLQEIIQDVFPKVTSGQPASDFEDTQEKNR